VQSIVVLPVFMCKGKLVKVNKQIISIYLQVKVM